MDSTQLRTRYTNSPTTDGYGMEFYYDESRPAYDAVETALSEEQWERLCFDGLEQDMIDTLLSPEGQALEDYIRQNEKEIICQTYELTMEEVEECLSRYSQNSDYFDSSIIIETFPDFDQAVKKKAWEWGMENEMLQVHQALECDDAFFMLDSGIVVQFAT